MHPIVSVIIPAYNTGEYIGAAIASVLNQTLADLEVIVVDDRSIDNTVEIVRSFRDDRLKLLENQQNLGAGGARNRALDTATGKWVAVLDSDDWYAPDRLERLVDLATTHQADLISDDLYLIEDGNATPWSTLLGESGERIDRILPVTPDYFINSDIEGKQGLRLGFSKPLFDRQFLERHQLRYDPTIKVSQDFWLYMDCFRYDARFFFVPQPYYYYRSREGSLINSDKIKRLDDECRAIANFLKHENYLNSHPQVLAALLVRQKNSRNYRDYYKFVEPLKRGQINTAIPALSRNFGGILSLLLRQIPAIVDRRIKSWFKGDRLVNNNMYRGNS